MKRQTLADHQWEMVQQEERQNEQLLDMSGQIPALIQAIHELTTATRDNSVREPTSGGL